MLSSSPLFFFPGCSSSRFHLLCLFLFRCPFSVTTFLLAPAVNTNLSQRCTMSYIRELFSSGWVLGWSPWSLGGLVGDRWSLTSRNEVSGKLSKKRASRKWGQVGLVHCNHVEFHYQQEGPNQLTYFVGMRSATQECVHLESLVTQWKTCF